MICLLSLINVLKINFKGVCVAGMESQGQVRGYCRISGKAIVAGVMVISSRWEEIVIPGFI